MEETLAHQSERDFLKAIEDNSQFLLTTFTQRHRRFDGESQNLELNILTIILFTIINQVSGDEWQLIKNLLRMSDCTIPVRWSDVWATKWCMHIT